MKRVLVGGGTGWIGKALCSSLRSKGYQVSVISRTKSKSSDVFTWDQISSEGLPACDAIVQIPGANIMDQSWTPQRKEELLQSRVGLTKILVDAIKRAEKPPKVLVSGSAIGYYPGDIDKTFDETYNGQPAQNFGGLLCSQWEAAVDDPDLAKKDVRVVKVRIGIVLEKDGGALQKMILPFWMGLGGPIGSGKQAFPWVHRKDLVGIFEHAVQNENVKGVLNAVAPEQITNAQFASTLGKVMWRPAFLPLPEFAVDLMFQERAPLLTKGSFIVPKRTLESGYKYQFDNLEKALHDILG